MVHGLIHQARHSAVIIKVFTLTLFLSALLLFLVQPMVAKMILPTLGGSSSVWNTCMVFFQAMLLIGYLYAHMLARVRRVSVQVATHLGLVAAALIFLPITLATGRPPVEASPTGWLLFELFGGVGFPFFVIASSAPLFQSWFTRTGHPHREDPYYLYAASNAGSLTALLAYPTIVEPALRLGSQSWAWAGGFVLLGVLAGVCGMLAFKGGGEAGAITESPTASEPAPPLRRILYWLWCAFVPSSLLLGVTTYMTTDIASVPLLWVIPLALYLLTFIFVFARRQVLPHQWVGRAVMIALVALVVMIFMAPSKTTGLAIVLHPLAFFLIAMLFHGELARTRPAARYLTGFYLWMSVGGVLGGIFNALLAPLLFNSLWEYTFVMGLAILTLPTGMLLWREFSLPKAAAVVLASTALALGTSVVFWSGHAQMVEKGTIVVLLGLLVSALSVRGNPRHAIIILLAATWALPAAMEHFGTSDENDPVLYQTRNHFGVHRVVQLEDQQLRAIFHGLTNHGQQSLRPEGRRVASAYHHPDGPLGEVFRELETRDGLSDVAVTGLGAGAIAAYVQPGQKMVFYEIDPAVVSIATNAEYFTYLSDCGLACSIVLGDARLTLEDAPDGAYGLLVLDAYSSGSVPVHLLTREALQVYLQKLAPGGLLAFNVSNQHLDFRPVLGNLAADANVVGLIKFFRPPKDVVSDVKPSIWAVLARESADLGQLAGGEGWHALEANPKKSLWTDDFSNIIEAYRWSK
ncbi:MAG: fused MFS/spermidine synthase [Bradymonadaceae bacterium]|nr:fused MFS/spermidine synthase [Lujinxingiaceae bacterium]